MAQTTVKDALRSILTDNHSSEVEALVEWLPPDNTKAIKRFCGQFDYLSDNPGWLFDSLVACGSDLVDILDDIVFDKRAEEQESATDWDDVMRDLRAASS